MDAYYRTMSLDLGDVRIGIAISDIMGIVANGLETYTRINLGKDINHIVNLINQNNVKVVVLGLPLNMDGTKGERVEKTYSFAKELQKHTDVKIDYIDERLTSVAAEKVLISADVSRKKRKNVIDKMAATIMLQDYLNMHTR